MTDELMVRRKEKRERRTVVASERDADQLAEDCKKLTQALFDRGVAINLGALDLNNLKPRIEAFAACRMLVQKGICTEAELAAECNTQLRGILAGILQAVEEQQLQQLGKVQPVRQPLVVAH